MGKRWLAGPQLLVLAEVDVLPVLAANCVRCHGYPTSGFATPGFRLDSFGPTLLASGELIRGASENATAIARRTKAAFRPPGELAMPVVSHASWPRPDTRSAARAR